MKTNLLRLISFSIVIILSVYIFYDRLFPNGYNRWIYGGPKYDDFVQLLENDLMFFYRVNFMCPRDIDELIHYIEYTAKQTDDDAILLQTRKAIIKYLKNNKKKLSLELSPESERDTSISLLYKTRFITNTFYAFPAIDAEFSDDKSFSIYESSLRDSAGKIYYSPNIEDEINIGLKRINYEYRQAYIDDNKLNLHYRPILFEWKKGYLKDVINDYIIDCTGSLYKEKIYSFLDSIGTSYNLSTIITSCNVLQNDTPFNFK